MMKLTLWLLNVDAVDIQKILPECNLNRIFQLLRTRKGDVVIELQSKFWY